MRAWLLVTVPFAPMLTGLIAALFQPHDQPAYRTRYRCFRSCGAGRRCAALWVLF